MNRREELIKMAYCPCTKCRAEMDEQVIDIVMEMERQTGKEVRITSGVRCQEENKRIGGYKDSPHIPEPKGKAVDMQIKGMANIELAYAAERAGFKRIGIYPNHVHGDILDPKPSKYWYLKSYQSTAVYSKGIKTLKEFLDKLKEEGGLNQNDMDMVNSINNNCSNIIPFF